MKNAKRRGFGMCLKLALALTAGAPLFQAAGCTLFEPRNLWRIGFDALLNPLSASVLELITAAGGV